MGSWGILNIPGMWLGVLKKFKMFRGCVVLVSDRKGFLKPGYFLPGDIILEETPSL